MPAVVAPLKPGTVSSLVNKHAELIVAASPPPTGPPSPTLSRSALQPSPSPQLRSSSPSWPAPSSPSPRSPAMLSTESTSTPPAASNGSPALDEAKGEIEPATAAAASGAAEVAADGEKDAAQGLLFPAPAPADAAANGGAEATSTAEVAHSEAAVPSQDALDAAASLPTPPPTAPLQSATGDSPLAKILEGLPALSIKEQEIVQKNLERIGGYPRELPLSASWTMFFSDTSRATKSSGATQEQYTESQTELFTVNSVSSLAGSLKAYKRLVRSKRAPAGNPDTMGLATFRPGQNLHFFRQGVSPTWEDPWNEKGGRITISPPSALIDACYERLVLLIAGSALEASTSDIIASPESGPGRTGVPEGLIIGAVASRRARGDRIELWLGGAKPREPAPSGWVEILKECLATELDMPELRAGKYKKHL